MNKTCDIFLSIYFVLLLKMDNNNAQNISDVIHTDDNHKIIIEYIRGDRNSCPIHRKHVIKGTMGQV